MVAISLLKPNRTPIPLVPTVTAIAAPTPRGARYITYFVKRNMTSASDSKNAITGPALSPMDAHAAPKIKANTTICSTSLRAMASAMLAGKTCWSSEAKVVGVAGIAASAAVLARAMPSPGRTTFTITKPSRSASVVAISKYRIALPKMRPMAFRSRTPPIPTTSVERISGAMITRIRRRNTSLTGASCLAKSGVYTPRAMPSAIPMKIHAVRESFFIVRPI